MLKLLQSENDRMLSDFLVQANRRAIPTLIDAERKREGLDDLSSLSSYVVCSAKFPQASLGFIKAA